VRYWDANEISSPYSNVTFFDTGLWTQDEWKGTWIGGFNQLRTEFSLSSSVERVTAFICGLGYYELYINGAKVGNNKLDPGWTSYDKRYLVVLSLIL
jgi:alpha-L-rhamnosidase